MIIIIGVEIDLNRFEVRESSIIGKKVIRANVWSTVVRAVCV